MRVLTAALLLATACAPTPEDVAVSGETTVAPMAADPPVPWPTTTTTTTQPVTTTTTEAVVMESVVTVAPTTAPVTYDIHGAIAAHFGTGELGRQAQAIAACESQLNPRAVSPTNDHGLFQLHAGSAGFPGGWVATFEDVTGAAFYDGVYDPYLNARFARWMYDRSGWQPWACRGAAA